MGCGFITKIALTTKAQTNKTTPQFVIAPLPVAMATATAICILLLLHLVRVHVSQNVHHSMHTATRPTPTQFPSMQMTTHAQRQMKTAVIGHDATVASCLNLLLHRSPWPWQQPLLFAFCYYCTHGYGQAACVMLNKACAPQYAHRN